MPGRGLVPRGLAPGGAAAAAGGAAGARAPRGISAHPRDMTDRFKTRMCHHWVSSGGVSCPHGPRCTFAHGPAEVTVGAAAASAAAAAAAVAQHMPTGAPTAAGGPPSMTPGGPREAAEAVAEGYTAVAAATAAYGGGPGERHSSDDHYGGYAPAYHNGYGAAHGRPSLARGPPARGMHDYGGEGWGGGRRGRADGVDARRCAGASSPHGGVGANMFAPLGGASVGPPRPYAGPVARSAARTAAPPAASAEAAWDHSSGPGDHLGDLASDMVASLQLGESGGGGGTSRQPTSIW